MLTSIVVSPQRCEPQIVFSRVADAVQFILHCSLGVPLLDDPRVPDSRVLRGGPPSTPVATSSEPPACVRRFISWLIFAVAIGGMRCRNLRIVGVSSSRASTTCSSSAHNSFHGREQSFSFFAATLAVPPQSPRLAQFGSARHTAQTLGATCTLRYVKFASTACVDVTPLSPGLAPADSAQCIAPACDVDLCVPRQLVLVVLRALV